MGIGLDEERSTGSCLARAGSALEELRQSRQAESVPSLPLQSIAGRYESPLYGILSVRIIDDSPLLTFDGYETPLQHWQADSWHARTPTRLTFDWLLTFERVSDWPGSVTVRHIGWDKAERDHNWIRIGD